MRVLALTMLFSAAGPLAAEPFLTLPIDCDLGETCFVEDYVDIDPSAGALDFTCGPKTRDGHSGTDFALPDMAAMDAGVIVLAAADGIVEAVRDGVPDRILQPDGAASIDGQECGNAVRIGHAGGLKTLYCHMRAGSVAVSPGDRVATGTPLGRVGLSGQTTFPHLHFSVLEEDGTPVDPFAPGAGPATCGTTAGSLWIDPLPHTETGFHTAGFATASPDLDSIRDGSARAAVATPADSIVLYGFVFLARTGDVMTLRATGPEGEIFARSVRIDAGRAQLFRAFGRRAPAAGWPPGQYVGETRLERGDRLIGTRQAYIEVTAD